MFDLTKIKDFFAGLPEHIKDNKWLAAGMVVVYALLLIVGVPTEAASGAVLGIGPLILFLLSARDTKVAREKIPKEWS